MRRVLTLDAATAVCSAGLVEDDVLLGHRQAEGDLAALPSLVEALLAEGGRALDLVAVIVGPGSFTGLRASVALAHGIGLAAGAAVVGVSVGAALEADGDAPLWVAIDSKRGGLFLERDGRIDDVALAAVPLPDWPILLGGDMAARVADALIERGATVQVLAAGLPDPLGIARAARAGRTRPPLPLYVQPPAARPGPAGRPAPA